MRKLAIAAAIVPLLVALAVAAPIDILTNRYDGARTGANLSETVLTTANVNVSQFGKLYTYPVDGSVYAQPLYVRGVTVAGAPRNLLFVVTMNDKVYAFDTDSSSATPVWMKDLTNPPSVVPVPVTDIATGGNIVGNVGIQSTPVIDPATRTMYLVARTKESGNYVQRLHALDIGTGQPRTGSPVKITATVPGNAPDAVSTTNGTVITFDPRVHLQRAGLALTNGVVLISWASHEDIVPSHGWIMGYDAATLAQVGAFAATPDTYNGGIWQGGRAPTIDSAGNAYFATGNGKWDGVRNYGDSLLKLGVSRSGLTLLDYFTPGNENDLRWGDDDLSGSGFTLLPGTNLMLGGGKEGVLYLLNADNLGRKVAGDTQIVQKIGVTGGHVMGGPVFWKSPAGSLVYNWSEDDVLKAYLLSGGRLTTTPYAQGSVLSPGHPGGSLTVSANAGTANTGIVWALMPTKQDGITGLVAGVLRAFHAATLQEIWSSEQNIGRDRVGTLIKFVPPVVVDGRVYVPTHDNSIAVYGLLPSIPPATGTGNIGINFVGSNTASMAVGETAGVLAQSHWNNAAGPSRSTGLPLLDDTGAATAASVTWSSNNTWTLPIADTAGNARLMKGYLDTTSTSTTTVRVTGLVKQAYDVYVYADGDNLANPRSAAYTISGPGVTSTTVTLADAASTNFSGGYTAGNNGTGNYIKFSINAAEFSIAAAPLAPASGTRRAPINAVQIVPAAPPATPARTVSVDFVGNSTVTMSPTETAGAVAKSHWNAAAGPSRASALPLVDETGATTAATITWSASGTWATVIADQPGNARMMKGYLDTTSTSTTTLTVAGLAPHAYEVYVYADGANSTFTRTAGYTISGPGITTATLKLIDPADTNFAGSFVAANNSNGNYVKFTINGSGFTITATPLTGTNATLRAPLNGIQIVPVP